MSDNKLEERQPLLGTTYNICTSEERLVLVGVISPIFELNRSIRACENSAWFRGHRVTLMAWLKLRDISLDGLEVILTCWAYQVLKQTPLRVFFVPTVAICNTHS